MQKVAYRPATLLGIVACAGLPLATYWRGEGAIPLVLALSVVVRPALVPLRRGRRQAGAEPRGHAARRRLRRPARRVRRAASSSSRTESGMLLGAIIATVAYDVGGLFVGSSAGRSPLAPDVSPNKTVEGLAGGMLMAILAAVVICGSVRAVGRPRRLAQARRRRRDRRAARRPRRVDVQARPRHQGLRHDPPGPRRRPRPLRRASCSCCPPSTTWPASPTSSEPTGSRDAAGSHELERQTGGA